MQKAILERIRKEQVDEDWNKYHELEDDLEDVEVV